MHNLKNIPFNLEYFNRSFPYGIVYQISNGQIMDANPAAERILGVSLDQLKLRKSNNPFWKSKKTDGSKFHRDEYPAIRALKTGRPISNVVMGVCNPSMNVYKWLKIDAVPVFDTGNDKPDMVYSIFQDITEEFIREQAHLDLSRSLTNLMDNLREMVYRCKIDENWTMLSVSNYCYELTGYHPTEILGNARIAFADLIHPDDRNNVAEAVHKAVQTDKSFQIQYRIITATGKVKYVFERGKAVVASNKNIFLEGIIGDETENVNTKIDLSEKEQAISQSINGLTFSDFDGNLIFANQTFCNMWRYAEHEVLGMHVTRFWKSPEKAQQVMTALIQNGKWIGELKALRKDNTTFRALLSANIIKDASGKSSKFMATFVDITRQYQIHKQFRQRLRIEKTISQISSKLIEPGDFNDAINYAFHELGQLTSAGRIYLFRFNSEGTIMKNTHEWCAPGVSSQIDSLQELPAEIFPWWMKKLRKNEFIQIKDVSEMPPEASAEKEILEMQEIKSLLVLPVHIRSKLTGFIGFDFIKDKGSWSDHDMSILLMISQLFSNAITRNYNEQQLLLFKTAITESPINIIIVNNHGIVEYVNPYFLKISGLKPEEITGKRYDDVRLKEGIELISKVKHTMATGMNWSGEIKSKTLNGDYHWEKAMITVIKKNNGHVSHHIIFAQDITEIKKNQQELILAKEKAEESDRLKSTFLATVSHELKTPLNGILGFSQVIRETSDNELLINYATMINQSGHRLEEIVDDIFELAFAQKTKIKIRKHNFKVHTLFHDIKEQSQYILTHSNNKEGVDMQFFADENLLSETIVSDKNKILQVILNLVKNAVKFTGEGFIHVKFLKGTGSQFIISVSDSGIGIPSGKLHLIFEFFRQVDDSNTRKHDGLGIGLAISDKIAKAMKGKIDVNSEPGKGSTFSFTFPVKFANTESFPSPEAISESPA